MPFIRSREELATRLEGARGHRAGASVSLRNVEAHGDGVIADAIIVAPAGGDEFAWRLALAIRVAGESISEVRSFWQRDAALAALGSIVHSG
jgi:ketosteroid isomerase-like protein